MPNWHSVPAEISNNHWHKYIIQIITNNKHFIDTINVQGD